MQTLDDMSKLALITADQHAEMRQWIMRARTPEEIMQMPAALWRRLELASVLMGLHADLSQAPTLQWEP